MRDVIPEIDQWIENNEKVAIATVIHTWGSSPRGMGSKMALTPGGKITGSVSMGCVEGAVFESGLEVLRTGLPQRLHFGVADEIAWQVGLSCGGNIDIFVQPINTTIYNSVRSALETEFPLAIATITAGPSDLLGKEILILEDGQVIGDLTGSLRAQIVKAAESPLKDGQPQLINLIHENLQTLEVFINVILPSPQIVIIGGVHIAIALSKIARTLGYRTVVIDPREVFANPIRFTGIDRLIHKWPDEGLAQLCINRSTAIVALSHDPKLDDPALMVALNSPAFYVGALGSRKTNAQRRQRLLEAGLIDEQLDRLHAPIGLNIGARSPEEIALSIMAEIVSVHNNNHG